MSKSYYTALTIAGSDCSGGAGIQADLKTFSALGVYSMSVITAITAQNTKAVTDVMGCSPKIVGEQIDAVFDDIIPDAVKIGMLHDTEIIKTVASRLCQYAPKHIVLDPVMISTSGCRLVDENAISTLIEHLLPIADIITPNKFEAEFLAQSNIDTIDSLINAGNKILSLGAKSVLIKGGHFDDEKMTDYYFYAKDQKPIQFHSHLIETANTHGTGCTLSSAIAAYLALGKNEIDAIGLAKEYLTSALAEGRNIKIGSGHGPVNHLFNPKKINIKCQ